MPTMILDPELERRLRAERARTGSDRYDEVWEGTYMMAPLANNEHQWLVMRLARILDETVSDGELGQVFPGCNVSDRESNWLENYRIPDIAVFLNDTAAVNRGAYWWGGPEFAVEIVSAGDRSREKLDFYAKVGTQELLVLDREPWSLELYRVRDGEMKSDGRLSDENDAPLHSETLSLSFELRQNTDAARPSILIVNERAQQTCTIKVPQSLP